MGTQVARKGAVAVSDRPTLTPSRAERRALTLERRFTLGAAPRVPARRSPGHFAPVEGLFWVNLDEDRAGRWSVYLWGARVWGRAWRDCEQFNGPIADAQVLTTHCQPPVPGWAVAEIARMLADLTTNPTLQRGTT